MTEEKSKEGKPSFAIAANSLVRSTSSAEVLTVCMEMTEECLWNWKQPPEKLLYSVKSNLLLIHAVR